MGTSDQQAHKIGAKLKKIKKEHDLVIWAELEEPKSRWQIILESIQASPGFCALRRNRESGDWWIDPSTFGLSAEECRRKLPEYNLVRRRNNAKKDTAALEFAKQNPALAIIDVEVAPKGNR